MMTAQDRLTILFLAANPVDSNPLQLEEEVRAVDDALRKSAFRDRFELRSHWAVRYGDLQELFLRLQPHIVHFSGHGSPAGEIVLKGNDGAGRTVSADALAGLFEILKDNVRCVVLNACYSEGQAYGIAQHIDFVVGMSRAITDAAAMDFASAFYLGLGYGRSVKTAFELGCNRIDLAGLDEKDTPQLLALRDDPATILLAGEPGGSADFDAGVFGVAERREDITKHVETAQADSRSPLSGRQIEQIHKALLDSFASRDALRMLARIELEQNLDAIAGGENLRVVVFNLVNWAEQTGRVLDLIQGAFKQNQGNVKLQALVQDAQEWFAPPLSPAAVPEAPLRRPDARAVPASIDVFLSYSRKDEAIMRQVQDSLRAAGLSVWIDEGLEPGTAGWQEAIAEAIDQAQVMVVLLSPASNQSPWVKNEISFAQSRGKRICPVLVSGDTERSVPIGLINVQWADGREDLRRALAQQLLPSLRRSLSSPDEPAPAAGPTATAETVVPGGPPAPQPVTQTGQPQETVRRNPALFWIVIVMSVIAVGAIGYFVVGRLQFPAFRLMGTPEAMAATEMAAPATNTPVIATGTSSGGIIPPAAAINTATNTPSPTATSTATATPTNTATAKATATATPTPTNIPIPTATNTVAKPSAPEAGDIWTNPKDGAEYVFIPAGTFMIGSAADDRLAGEDERPQHPVTLDGYWIMRTEVTNGQYKRCVDAGDCTPPGNSEYNKEGFEMRPVTHVDWHQASAYAVWAGGELPTEAEWEYACRGGDGRIYPWGNEQPSAERLNYHGSDIGDTTDVGRYPAGANDLFDMAGNVWEWTADWYGAKYYAESPEQNPPGPRDGEYRVLRGGSFLSDGPGGHFVRCADRGWLIPDFRDGYYGGFRVMSPGS